VQHPDEVAAGKTLTLFGRAAVRDLVDVHALSLRYRLNELCGLAAEKDAGFNDQRSPTHRTLQLPTPIPRSSSSTSNTRPPPHGGTGPTTGAID
jgi:hypothetical protein